MFACVFDPEQANESASSAADQRKFPYRYTVRRLLHGRPVCFTREGYMGYMGQVHSNAAVGDVIAVAAGAKLHSVLRNAMDETDGDLLVSDGYLRGFMHGEGISENELKEIRLV